MLQPNAKVASLKEQALFYADIPDDDSIDYNDVDVEKKPRGTGGRYRGFDHER
jgi:hypothetical protein